MKWMNAITNGNESVPLRDESCPFRQLLYVTKNVLLDKLLGFGAVMDLGVEVVLQLRPLKFGLLSLKRRSHIRV